jgi:putative membrane protein
VALLTGVFMMLLDVVIDPAAVRGDRWFLGRIFYYPEGGVYFGVPISNFVGWTIVGGVGVGGFLVLDRWLGHQRSGHTLAFDHHGRGVWPGIALYYAVLAFNLVLTGWIGEWLLLGLGTAIHAVTGAVLLTLILRPAVRLGLEKQRA